jgi:hypothetical protein
MHHQVYDETCQNCHTTANPGGTDNSSFCSNSACHGTEWVYAGFDAPGLRDILVSQLPPTPTPAPIPSGGPLTFTDTIGPILGSRCSGCHGTEGIQGLNLTDYQSILTGGESGPAVVPGDPGASLIVIKNSQELPHFGQLSTEELDLIVQWITGGAPEN